MNIATNIMYYTVTLMFFLFLPACSTCNRDKQGNTDSDVFTTEFTTNNWVYTDEYGRSVSGYADAGARRDKLVGVFYFLWHKGNRNPNNTDFFRENPNGVNLLVPGRIYYWGEPEDGYYSSKDPWIIRKHLRLLSLAEVDFLYFDTTNGVNYLDVVEEICKVAAELHAEGIKVPQIIFTTNYKQTETILELYEKFYKPKKYRDMWLMWEGKPVILAPENVAPNSEISDFFTWRYGWSSWGDALKNSWCWFNVGGYGYTDNPEKAEQMVVSKGSHPTINVGSSYRLGPDGKIAGGTQPPMNEFYSCAETGRGDMFEKQWEKVFAKDPEVVMITQWNEWLAVCCSRKYCIEVWKSHEDMINETFLGKTLGYDDCYFVDPFNDEYNRDIEPMKGGYGDVFYYRMIHYIRKFKGMDKPVPSSRPKTITIDGNFAEWMNVLPIFTDHKGDVKHRNFTVGDTQFTNNTGRNDIIQSRVARDNQNVYFYVSTEDKITPYTDPNWMLLYINADCNRKTGWEGYDFLVNAEVKSSETTTLKYWNGNSWEQLADIPYRVSEGEMELSIPLAKLNFNSSDISFDFKWADNIQQLDDINEFFINGDVAPERRFDYQFIWKQ